MEEGAHGPHCMTGIGPSMLCTCGPNPRYNELATAWNYGKGPHPNDCKQALDELFKADGELYDK